MVQMMNSGKVAVKSEVEDPLEEAHAPLNKRSKLSFEQQSPVYNPLDEPSPLGLRLRKSPSLLELIQMRLSQPNATKASGSHGKKDQKSSGNSGTEKLKASNFPASILRIGTWEYKSRYEGDLVAKCYFAKHKLVWEVLDGGLKNKIEIQWSDIMALKANYPDDGPGTLDVVLARQPLFYRETNPQPRKHTLWQATSDFTDGQASIHKRHYLQCPQGLLGKHFEKLVQCDPRLNFLSQQPEIILESPYFEPRIPAFEDPCVSNNCLQVNTDNGRAPLNLLDATSPSKVQSSSLKNEQYFVGRLPESVLQETLSPRSVVDSRVIEEIRRIGQEQWKDPRNWDNIKVPGLHTSMSMTDLVNHLEQRVSEQRTSSNFTLSSEERQSLDILEEISRCLFNDTQSMPASDEKTLMSRVNSLCCLLQKDPSTVQNFPSGSVTFGGAPIPGKSTGPSKCNRTPISESKGEENCSFKASDDFSGCKQTSSMSRIDSVGELLLSLPRIASLPRFLFNIGDDYDNQAR